MNQVSFVRFKVDYFLLHHKIVKSYFDSNELKPGRDENVSKMDVDSVDQKSSLVDVDQ